MYVHSTQEIGRAVREARKRRGLGQKDLALAAGTGRRFIVDLEAGKGTVQTAEALRVLEALGLRVEVGREPAGTIALADPDAEQAGTAPNVKWLEEADLAPALAEQDKLPVVVDGERLGVPLSGAASTHLLTIVGAGFDTSPLNEAFCMWLAGRLDLAVSPVELLEAAGRSVLLVERCDRVAGDEGVRRLRQEDFLEAMGRSPDAKREADGGPGIVECVELIRRACTCPAQDLLAFVDGVFLNLLIGNGAADAGSFSLLHAPEDPFVRLAPLCDLVCTAVDPAGPGELPMVIGGESRPEDVGAKAIRRLAEEAQLGHAALRGRVHDLAARASMAAGALARAVKDGGIDGEDGTANRIAATVNENATHLRKALRHR